MGITAARKMKNMKELNSIIENSKENEYNQVVI
jgi:hypothetical protein